jgi:eukaryotic-like serine/threonine-protein kinase
MRARLAPGTMLANTYRIIRLIGVGGMGEVYEASHARLAGRYAVKVLGGESVGGSELLQRFAREAEVTSGLRHPNIVQVVDFNLTPDGDPYLVMEFLEGVELAAEIRRVGAMPMDRVLDIVGQIASGLAAAHSHKVVHRDLKPQNMFLVKLPGSEREVVKMVDFGISKVREATTKLTMEAAILGTPQYMAPEQAQGRQGEINELTDQFALAAITYELIAGRTAFAGGSVPAILFQVVHEQPAPLAKVAPNVGPAVEAVVWKALSKAQGDRYPSVLAFHAALVHAAATDRQVYTIETPSPLWLPAGASAETDAVVDPAAPSSLGAGPIVPAARLPQTAPTARLPQVAPTARLVETEKLAAGAGLGPVHDIGPTTTLRAAVASFPTAASTTSPRRRWLLPTLGIALALMGGLGYWGARSIRIAVPTGPAVAPDSPAPRPAPSPPPAVLPKTARVLVENAPPGLRVTVDGTPTELPIVLPAGPDIHTLRFEAPGHHATEFHVDGLRESRSLVLAMQPVVVGAAPAVDEAAAAPPASTEEPEKASRKRSQRQRKRADIITDR